MDRFCGAVLSGTVRFQVKDYHIKVMINDDRFTGVYMGPHIIEGKGHR